MLESREIENRIDSIIRFFLYVLIAMLPYSPAAVEICVSFSMVLWFTKRTFRLVNDKNIEGKKSALALLKYYLPVKTPINVYIYWFMLACVLSAVGSVYQAESLKGCFTKILEWFIIYFIVVEVINEKKHIKIIFILFFLTSLVLIADGILQYYILRKDVFFGRVLNAGDRPTAAFKTPSDFGAFVTVFVPVVLTTLFYRNEKKFLYILGSLIGLWALWIIGARAAWMGVVLSLIILIGLMNYDWFKNKAGYRLKIILFISLAVILCLSIWGFKSFLEYRSVSVDWRRDIWRATLPMIQDRPFFGHGINTFMKTFKSYSFNSRYYYAAYAHNSVLQMAAETGIFGLFWFLMILGKIFDYGYSTILKFTNEKYIQMICLGFLSGALALFIQSISDTSFQSLQLSALFWYMAGVGMAGTIVLNAGLKKI